MTKDSIYTLFFDAPAESVADPITDRIDILMDWSGNIYTRGRCEYGPTYDLLFRTYVDTCVVACCATSSTDTQTACDSYLWIDGNTYTSNNNTATHTLTNAANCDSVVTLDLTITNSTSGTDTQTACDSFLWIDGNTYTSSNNTATHTLTNAANCDSVVTLDLTITAVDVSVTDNSPTLIANATGVFYQWTYCDSVSISGATNQAYTAAASGSYAVIITQNTCVDTSVCYAVNIIGITEDDFAQGLSVFPNPAIGVLNIDFGRTYQTISISVKDVTGKLLTMNTYSSTANVSLDMMEAPGMYFIDVSADGAKKAVLKVIKK